MPVTDYYRFGSVILGARTDGGTWRNYGRDALGSVTFTKVGDVGCSVLRFGGQC
jgi:hypothetical protein